MKQLIIILVTFLMMTQGSALYAQDDGEFSWEMFLPAITAWEQEFSCANIAGCYSGSLTDNCGGESVTGTVGVSINTDCSFTGVSIFGGTFSGNFARRKNDAYVGTGETPASGCGSFTVTCTDQGSSISCSYDYTSGGSGTIQNGAADQCMPANRFLTRSLAGSWSFTYQIISIFTDYYNLDINEVYEEPAGSGEYYIYDTNYFYGAGYDPESNIYFLYDPGYPFDIFYSFIYTSTNEVAGCYYQYYYDTDTLSDCYPMSGERTSSGF